MVAMMPAWLLRSERIARAKPSAVHGAHTTSPVRFVTREFIGTGVGVYGLKVAPEVRVALRHGTADAQSFNQIFLQDAHGEPPAAAAAIAALGRPPRVLDLGGNVGLYAAWAEVHWPGCSVTTVEPDPENAAVLRVAAAANGARWAVIEAAAGTSDGELAFRADGSSMARAVEPGDDGPDVVNVVMIDALKLADGHDVMKLDIEGGEWAILADPRLASSRLVAITVEYHAHLCPGPDTHGLAQALLRDAGFQVSRQDHVVGAPPEEGVLWAWRAS
jgi:FkbM family methyltransferase